MKPNRRQFGKAFAVAPLSFLLGAAANSQTLPPLEGMAPGKSSPTTRPFRSVNVPEDGRRVLFFFDFACPFCTSYHEPLSNFSETVPKQIQTLFVPVVNIYDLARSKEQMIAAKCYYAAAEIASKPQMKLFVSAVYKNFVETRNLTSMDVWRKAVIASSIDMKKFVAVLNGPNTDFKSKFAARKAMQYALSATPSVGIGGKYVMTPENVNGDSALFFQILNGLTSEIL